MIVWFFRLYIQIQFFLTYRKLDVNEITIFQINITQSLISQQFSVSFNFIIPVSNNFQTQISLISLVDSDA